MFIHQIVELIVFFNFITGYYKMKYMLRKKTFLFRKFHAILVKDWLLLM